MKILGVDNKAQAAKHLVYAKSIELGLTMSTRVMRKIGQLSAETDCQRRVALVHAGQSKSEQDTLITEFALA